MHLPKWFDGVLKAAAQKFCDKFQQFTGLTKFRLEKWAWILSLASTWWAVLTVVDTPLVIILLAILSALFCTTMGLHAVRSIEQAEIEFLENGRLVAFLSSSPPMRLVGVYVLGVMGIFNLLFFGRTGQAVFCQQLFIVVAIYLSVCIPRPPGKSRAREWYEGALTWLDDRLGKSPEPAM